jgi:hypothetical protein
MGKPEHRVFISPEAAGSVWHNRKRVKPLFADDSAGQRYQYRFINKYREKIVKNTVNDAAADNGRHGGKY